MTLLLQRAAVHDADEEDADTWGQEHRAASVAAAVQERNYVRRIACFCAVHSMRFSVDDCSDNRSYFVTF